MNINAFKCSFLALAFLATLGAGAASAGSEKLANIHSVAVISAIGDELELRQVGLTVFSNAETPVSTRDWNLDDAIEKTVGASLASRFTIVQVPHDRGAFAAIKPGLFNSFEHQAGKLITAMPAGAADAYVVIFPMTLQDPIMGTNQNLTGMGLYHRDLMFGNAINALYAFYEVGIFDAKTGDMLSSGGAESTVKTLFGYAAPSLACDASLWPDPPESLTAAQRDQIKGLVFSLIGTSLDHGLANADLIDDSLKLNAVNIQQAVQPDQQVQPH
jgi:hypothetical protein